MKTKEQQIQMPVSKLHYSMMTQLLRNPLIFKLKYVLGVYDGKVGMSGMVGRAGHEALKVYYGGHPDVPCPKDPTEARAVAIDHGMQYLTDYSDIYIEYGKTGNREKMLKTYAQAMGFYFAEEPEYHDIKMCEKKLEAEIHTVDGDQFALPAVGIPDLVHTRKDGGTEIIDIKFVKTFTDYETEDYIKIVQSQFLWHLLRDSENITADRMLFREIKVTENSGDNAGKPQVRDYAIPFTHDQYRIIFYNLYRDCIKFLSNPEAVYLPNLSDPFDGEQAGLLYAQGLLSADMSDVEVMHKVKDVAFISKKFVSSRLERVENKHLPIEEKIKLRLAEFGIPVEPEDTIVGTTVTQYRFKVSAGIRMASVLKHKADITRAVETAGEIRILAPIPGTALIGIEVPNTERSAIMLGKEHYKKNTLSIPIGAPVHGEAVTVSLIDMPHLLIAGSTGSGKSVLIHSILTALTAQMNAKQMHLFLIDPKRVELVAFAKKPHLHGSKIAYEYLDAILILAGLSGEMEARYKALEKLSVRNIQEYNAHMHATKQTEMPYMVLVIDEFADLMLQGKQAERKKKRIQSLQNVAMRVHVDKKAREFAKHGMSYKPRDVDDETPTAEEMITRLASMARAVGIHLIIATQRPSVDVITGIIKANFPTRIALTTASATDSKVILGIEGAEKLSGKGDMLFQHPGGGLQRLQGFKTE